jgi:hypothetical protein
MRRKKLVKTRSSGTPHPAPPIPIPPPRLASEHDNVAVEQLANAPIGTLEVDRFAEFVTSQGRSGNEAVAELRRAVVQIYVDAARFRADSKPSKQQLKSAEIALSLLWKASRQLEGVQPRHTRGLQGAFGIPGDDPKGADELTIFSSRCWATRLEITKIAMDLDTAIRAEKAKPSARGERKKRLRILTEALAEWFSQVTGKSIAPYVQSRRGKQGRTVVVRRSGSFVEFAKSVLFELDDFNPTEVTSAASNVYEQRRPKGLGQHSRKQKLD